MLTTKICAAVRRVVVKDVSILFKIRKMPTNELLGLVQATVGRERNADGISAVNSDSAEPYVETGFGKKYLMHEFQAALAGRPLFKPGLETVSQLDRIRAELKLTDMIIVGGGGVATTQDFLAYLKAGATVVQVVSQCLIDSYFPYKLRRDYDDEAYKDGRVKEQDQDTVMFHLANAARRVEQKTGLVPGVRERVVSIALEEMIAWKRRWDATTSLGPQRSRVPSVEEFVQLIESRLRTGR
jgi:hypothetical protein